MRSLLRAAEDERRLVEEGGDGVSYTLTTTYETPFCWIQTDSK